MREASFVGVTADGEALLIRVDDEHVTVPLDDRLRRALTTSPTMQLPLAAESVTPREAQRRMRCGESAASIADSAGVAIEAVARFEGPVLDERRWHAEQARRTTIDDVTLEDRLVSASGADTAVWDAWVDADDGNWRIGATTPDGRVARWSWDPRTHRLRGLDDLARRALSGSVVADDLEAVLRPVASARRPVEEPEPQPEPAPREKKGRVAIPAWDEILFSSTKRDGD